jgi:hypothetical protein
MQNTNTQAHNFIHPSAQLRGALVLFYGQATNSICLDFKLVCGGESVYFT